MIKNVDREGNKIVEGLYFLNGCNLGEFYDPGGSYDISKSSFYLVIKQGRKYFFKYLPDREPSKLDRDFANRLSPLKNPLGIAIMHKKTAKHHLEKSKLIRKYLRNKNKK